MLNFLSQNFCIEGFITELLTKGKFLDMAVLLKLSDPEVKEIIKNYFLDELHSFTYNEWVTTEFKETEIINIKYWSVLPFERIFVPGFSLLLNAIAERLRSEVERDPNFLASKNVDLNNENDM